MTRARPPWLLLALALTACELVAGLSERDSVATGTVGPMPPEPVEGEERACSEDSSLAARFGSCAGGKQRFESGAWSACSIQPAQADRCEPGNDDSCDGVPNQGCACLIGDEPRSCQSDEQLAARFGACSLGQEVCRGGRWGPCSISPAEQDGCEPQNDADCDGVPNQGCPCVDGMQQPCGACGGTSVCVGGAWGECMGEAPQQLFYPDRDQDGHGDPERYDSFCTSPPAGYVSTFDDCCDLDERAFPGQTGFFDTARVLCGGFDFDCDRQETQGATNLSCASDLTALCFGHWVDAVPACGVEGLYQRSAVFTIGGTAPGPEYVKQSCR